MIEESIIEQSAAQENASPDFEKRAKPLPPKVPTLNIKELEM